MAYNKKYISKSTDERETPWDLYNLLDGEFGFIADMAATKLSTKHNFFYTEEDDSLSLSWPKGPVFCNPPYSRGLVWRFVKKAREEAIRGCQPVLLLPVRTSATWWFKYVIPEDYNLKIEMRFLTPRVPFLIDGEPIRSKSGKPVGAMAPNVIVCFSPNTLEGKRMSVLWWNWKENEYY